jgi:hypothetical protein
VNYVKIYGEIPIDNKGNIQELQKCNFRVINDANKVTLVQNSPEYKIFRECFPSIFEKMKERERFLLRAKIIYIMEGMGKDVQAT